MLLFILMSLGVLIVITIAVEWILEAIPGQSDQRRLTMHQSELDEIYDDLLWQQMVIARGWPVSARFAQRAFLLVAKRAAMVIDKEHDPAGE